MVLWNSSYFFFSFQRLAIFLEAQKEEIKEYQMAKSAKPHSQFKGEKMKENEENKENKGKQNHFFILIQLFSLKD